MTQSYTSNNLAIIDYGVILSILNLHRRTNRGLTTSDFVCRPFAEILWQHSAHVTWKQKELVKLPIQWCKDTDFWSHISTIYGIILTLLLVQHSRVMRPGIYAPLIVISKEVVPLHKEQDDRSCPVSFSSPPCTVWSLVVAYFDFYMCETGHEKKGMSLKTNCWTRVTP